MSKVRFKLVDELRDEVASIVEQVGNDGLPGPRDLDVALDAIEAVIQAHTSAAPQPPVSQSVAMPEIPLGAIENGRELFRRVTDFYSFEDDGHTLRNCQEYLDAVRCFDVLAAWASELSAPQPPEGGTGWRDPVYLPECEDGERFAVYLAFSTGEVKLADWVAWTTYGSEHHATTGVYLGHYPQDGDALYMTDDGFEVRKGDDGFWFSEKVGDDGTKTPFYVVGWMEALKPLPPPPGQGDRINEGTETDGGLKCHFCNGVGHVDGQNECPNCYGAGLVSSATSWRDAIEPFAAVLPPGEIDPDCYIECRTGLFSSSIRGSDVVRLRELLRASEAPSHQWREAVQALVNDCDEYVRINNLHGSKGEPATWATIERVRSMLAGSAAIPRKDVEGAILAAQVSAACGEATIAAAVSAERSRVIEECAKLGERFNGSAGIAIRALDKDGGAG